MSFAGASPSRRSGPVGEKPSAAKGFADAVGEGGPVLALGLMGAAALLLNGPPKRSRSASSKSAGGAAKPTACQRRREAARTATEKAKLDAAKAKATEKAKAKVARQKARVDKLKGLFGSSKNKNNEG